MSHDAVGLSWASECSATAHLLTAEFILPAIQIDLVCSGRQLASCCSHYNQNPELAVPSNHWWFLGMTLDENKK